MIIDLRAKAAQALSESNLPTGIKKHFYELKQSSEPLKEYHLTDRVKTEKLHCRTKNTTEIPQKLSPSALNNSLAGRITEIITSTEEPSNFAMLLPLLATLSKDERWFAWISPPKNLPRSLLKEAGIALDKVMLLYPDDHYSALILAKKALSAGTCHAVISWSGELSEHEFANLELSAKQGASHGILIRQRGK